MFMLVSWFGLTLPLLNAADWFRCIRLLKRLFVSSHLSEVIYVWCYCWRYCFCRSEERFSRNAETDLVCRLLLEKKNFKVYVLNYRSESLCGRIQTYSFGLVVATLQDG